MKDKSLKDEVLYEVQFYDEVNKLWNFRGRVYSEESAENIIETNTRIDKSNGVVYEYRIVKLTTKKEVIK